MRRGDRGTLRGLALRSVSRWCCLVRRRSKLWLAGVFAGSLLVLAACGTQHAPSSPPVTESSRQALEGFCPQADAAVTASPCVSVGVQEYQRANQLFNDRIPLPGPVAAEAAPLTQRIRESLDQLTPAQRLQASTVRSALLTGGLLSTDLVVLDGPPHDSVAFGGYELLSTRPPVCAWGTVSVKAVEVDSGGITREGGCLPTVGGH
jgi:hypothetical protein